MATKKTASKTAAKPKTTTKKTSKSSTKKTKATKSSTYEAKMSGITMKRIRSTGWLAIFESLVVGGLGVMLLINADTVTQVAFYILGIFLIIRGIYKILNYFTIHGKYDFFNNDLLYGIIALVIGIVAVVLWQQLGGLLSVMVGAWMIYGALVRLNTAIKMRTAGIQSWFYVMLLSMGILALGLYLVVTMNAGTGIAITGGVMIASAIVSIVDDFIFIKHLGQISK